jgi:hypothetical protein
MVVAGSRTHRSTVNRTLGCGLQGLMSRVEILPEFGFPKSRVYAKLAERLILKRYQTFIGDAPGLMRWYILAIAL